MTWTIFVPAKRTFFGVVLVVSVDKKKGHSPARAFLWCFSRKGEPMKGLIAYSRPRGKYGRYVFTVLIGFEPELREEAPIAVVRPKTNTYQEHKYSCDHCGKWATISVTRTTTTYTPLEATEHRKDERLEFYRFDNIEPGDILYITMHDPDLLFYQVTQVTVTPKGKGMPLICSCHPMRDNAAIGEPPRQIYDVRLVNWEEYVSKRQEEQQETTVEEELIQQTMNGEPITITQLLLLVARETPQLPDGSRFIEGTLIYPPEEKRGNGRQ